MNVSSNVSLFQGSSSKVIVLQNGFTDSYVLEGSSVSFTLAYLQNPTQNASTDSFAFSTFDEAGYAIESLDFGMTIAATSGALTDVTFLPIEGQQGVYQFASDFNLTFTMENPFRTGAVLYIEFDEYLTSKTDFALMTD